MIGWPFYARHVSDFWSGNVSSRHSVARPVQRWANDGSGFQGFPWCCSAWKLFSPLRLYRMCPVYWSSFPSRMYPVYWSSFVTYSVERLVLHGANGCHIRWQFTIPMCPSSASLQWYLHSASWEPPVQGWCSTIASRLCRVDVAPLRPLRSNELFRHHTHLHRGVGRTAIINIAIRGVGYHKHCHQGSR